MAKQKPKLHTRKKLISKKRMFSFTRSSIFLMAAILVFMPFTTAKAAVLDVEILTNITSTNSSGTTSASPYPGSTTQNVDFKIHGDAPVSVPVLSGTRRAVLAIPAELKGQVTPSAASVTTDVTLDLNQVGLLPTVFSTTNSLVTTLTDILDGSLGSLIGVNLDTTQLYHDLDLLNSIQDIGGTTYTAATTFSPNGTMVKVDLDQGLGPILTQNVSDILNNLKTSINNLHAEVTGLPGIVLAALINTTLAPLKAAATAAIDNLLTPLLGGTDPTGVVDTLTQQLLTASVLGDTTVMIPTRIVIPATSTGVVDSKFVGTVVQTDLLDVDLLITANGVSDVFWKGQAPVITSTTGNSTTGDHEHYIKGYDTGIFGPENNITRAHVAAIAARACLEGFHEDTVYGNGGYTDVADDNWARSAIAFVTMAGVFEGDGDGRFYPDRPITRQEFALVFARMAGLLNVGEMPFSDADTTADWAISGVYTAYAKGWLDGYNDGTFKPRNNIKRSEAVKIVNRYLNRGVDATGITDVYSELKQWPDVPSTYWAYYEILEVSNDHTYFYADGEQPPEVYTKAYIKEASWGK